MTASGAALPGWVSRAVTRPPLPKQTPSRRLLQTTEHNQKGLRDAVLLCEQMLELASPVNPESQVCVSSQTRATAGNTVYGTPRGQVAHVQGHTAEIVVHRVCVLFNACVGSTDRQLALRNRGGTGGRAGSLEWHSEKTY